jgi:Iap family predicted aminopeptidase
MKRAAFVIALALCLSLVLAGPVLAGAAPTFDQAVDQLIAQGYPQGIENYLCGLGTSPLGFRVGGSASDDAAASYLAAQMRAIGLKNVRLEPVKMDVWEFRSASVTAGGRVLPASSYAGVPATPPGGLSGDVVYVGRGSAAEYDAAGSVAGKIVLFDFTDDHSPGDALFWSNLPAHEATLRGARAIVITTSQSYLGFFADPDSLGSNDGEHDPSWLPMVYIDRTDGDWLKQKLAAGRVGANVKLDADLRLASQGGLGYNVVGELPGSVANGEKIVVAGHHDAFFTGATDDTGACVEELLVAKAMKLSGYKPRRTLVFLATTGEEWGIVDSWYDWAYGSWYAATKTHTDWPGKVAAVLNMEGPGSPDGQLRFLAVPELVPWLTQVVADNPSLRGPNNLKTQIIPGADCGNDQWPFTAAGIPSVVLAGWPDSWFPWNYHTPNDSPEAIDWPFFGVCAKFMQRMVLGVDRAVPPYGMGARAQQLSAAVDPAALLAAGADGPGVTRFSAAVARFNAAASACDQRLATIPASRAATVSRQLMDVAKVVDGNLTALDWWDETIYPHEQVQRDLQLVNAAIAALEKPNPNSPAALAALADVGYTFYGVTFTPPVYLHELDRHDPDYANISWAGQGHLPQPIDVMPEYRQIVAGEVTTAIDDLTAERARQIVQLDGRLTTMSAVLESATAKLEAIR